MPINRYDEYAPTNWGGVKTFELPLDIMGKTLGALQDRSDKNYAQMQELPDLLKVNSLDPDRSIATGIQQKFQQQIDDLAKNSNGDFSNLNKQLYGLKSQIRKEITPGGTLHAINSNYGAYASNAKELQDMYKSGKITQDNYTAGLQYAKKRYGGIGQVDPTTGIYNQYQEMAIPSVDENKLFDAAIKNIKPDQMEKVGIRKDPSGNFFMITKEGNKYITEEKAYEALLPQILLDPDVQRMRQFRREVGLGDYAQNIDLMARAKARGLAFNEHSENLNMVHDPTQYQNAQLALGRARLALQQKALQPSPEPVVPMATTNISNLKGLDDSKFSAVNQFKKGDMEVIINAGAEGEGGMARVYTGKNAWVDENSSAAKNNPLIMAAIKKTRDDLRQQFGKDANGNYKVDNADFMKDKGDIWHSAIDNSISLLKNGGGFNSVAFPISKQGHDKAMETLITNADDIKLYEVDANGRVNTQIGSAKPLTDLIGKGAKIADLLKENAMTVGSKMDPVSTGVSGTRVTINGKQYISPNLVDPRMAPIEKQMADLGTKLTKYDQESQADLSFLGIDKGKVLPKVVGNTIMVTVTGQMNGKPYKTVIPLNSLEEASQRVLETHDPWIKATTPKAPKGWYDNDSSYEGN